MFRRGLRPSWGTSVHKILQRVEASWNVMAHTQKPDFVFGRNGRVHLNRRGRQFIRLLAAEVCASAVVMLDKPCSELVWRVLATLSIRHFPLYFPSRASPCAITFQLDSTRPALAFCQNFPQSKDTGVLNKKYENPKEKKENCVSTLIIIL